MPRKDNMRYDMDIKSFFLEKGIYHDYAVSRKYNV